MLLLGLLLAKNLSGVSLPAYVLERIQFHSRLEPLAREIQCNLFSTGDPSTAVADRSAFLLVTKERLRDKMRYSWYFTRLTLKPTSRDRALLHLPGILAFCYYLVRPFRLVSEYGVSPLFRFIRRLRSF
jgi:hypothetical protein